MQLRQLEAFVELAEEMHFGRAAARLRISQSALSQQLQRLESDLGAQLVNRTSREISLTEAGELFLEPARQTLASADRAESLLQDFKEGRTGRLVIGSLGAGMNGPLATIIRRFHEVMPRSRVELFRSGDSANPERELLTGSLDGAVLRRVANNASVASVRLFEESFVVYLPDHHPLATRDVLRLADLSNERFVFWPRRLGATFYDLIVDGCRAHGFEPFVEALGDALEAQLSLVAAGLGVSIQAVSNSSIRRSGTVVVPIVREDLTATLLFAYRRGNNRATLQTFLTCLEQARAEYSPKK